MLKHVGLTPSQFNLLQALDEGDGGPNGRSQTFLATKLLCTRANITRMVRRLENNGSIQLQKDNQDQRVIRVSLTEQGRAQLDAARDAMQTAVANRCRALDNQAQQQLVKLTTQIITALESDLHNQA
ncbi:MAG: MarR family transcriptional regulator [Chloroflexi bacterium]|nr:MarR family transcriptional regulator [Chloroflexota bacterium]